MIIYLVKLNLLLDVFQEIKTQRFARENSFILFFEEGVLLKRHLSTKREKKTTIRYCLERCDHEDVILGNWVLSLLCGRSTVANRNFCSNIEHISFQFLECEEKENGEEFSTKQ